MVSIFDVAKYILHQNNKISIWKLHNLCYYAQAYTMALYGEPLFHEDFDAWACGPVCPKLQESYKMWAPDLWTPKIEYKFPGDINNLLARDQDIIDDILTEYGNISMEELGRMVCEEEPWKCARRLSIPKDNMMAYYSNTQNGANHNE